MTKNKPATTKLKGPFNPEQKKVLGVRVAQLTAELYNIAQISDELNITRRQVRNLMDSEECKEFLEGLKENAKQSARAYLARNAKELISEAQRALLANLKDNNMEAVKQVLKVYGVVDAKEDVGDKEATVNIVMPSFGKEEIEVKSG